MPDEIEGQIVKRKDYVDFMDFSPACLSLKAVVSAKVKNVLEQIHVRKSEYILKRIKIDGIASDFYLLFVPIIKDTEFVYPKCEFIDIYNEKCKVFQNRKEFYNDNDIYFPKRITLTPKYKNQDLLYPQGSDVFFSKRVLDAFADEKMAQVRKSVDSPPDMLTERLSSHGTCFPIKSSTFASWQRRLPNLTTRYSYATCFQKGCLTPLKLPMSMKSALVYTMRRIRKSAFFISILTNVTCAMMCGMI